MIPMPPWFVSSPSAVAPTDTSALVSLISVPFAITVNKISLRTATNVSASPFDISLYSEDGQTRHISVSTAGSHSVSSVVSVAVSSVVLRPGYYWLLVNVDSATLTQVFAYDHADPLDSTASLLSDVSSEQILVGTYTITSGTPPATLTLANITESTTGSAVCVRFDN
jgi:hypothetical protein